MTFYFTFKADVGRGEQSPEFLLQQTGFAPIPPYSITQGHPPNRTGGAVLVTLVLLTLHQISETLL
jgi:hypothetical protein